MENQTVLEDSKGLKDSKMCFLEWICYMIDYIVEKDPDDTIFIKLIKVSAGKRSSQIIEKLSCDYLL